MPLDPPVTAAIFPANFLDLANSSWTDNGLMPRLCRLSALRP